MNPKFEELETHKDDRGRLTIIEAATLNCPFEIKRVFYIYDVPPDMVRGGHAHKVCHQLLIAVAGMVYIEAGGIEFILDNPDYGVYVPPGNIVTMELLSRNTCLLVLASEPYDKEDYIEVQSGEN
jgi:dTDP-4-dehydrorhamnose 3,5-epimerase-like enzyme